MFMVVGCLVGLADGYPAVDVRVEARGVEYASGLQASFPIGEEP
jgi:hypothetical protein